MCSVGIFNYCSTSVGKLGGDWYWWFGGGSLVMLMKIGDGCGLVVIGIGGLVGPNGGGFVHV